MLGVTTAGFTEYAALEIEVRGRYSEILEHRMIPDAPSQTEWRLVGLDFRPAE